MVSTPTHHTHTHTHPPTHYMTINTGQFGEVFKADYIPNGDQSKCIPVAVKTTKKDCTEKEKTDLLKEMAVMSCMVHPNIVKLYGVVTINVPAPWIILEYLPFGDLRHFLQVINGYYKLLSNVTCIILMCRSLTRSQLKS